MRIKLTAKRLAAVPRPTQPTGVLLWDLDLPGFAVRVFPSGKRVALIQYGPRGRQKRLRIGTIPPLTLDEARKLAREKLAEWAKGKDPAVEARRQRSMPSFRQWAKEYTDSLEGKRKSLRTMRAYLAEAGARWGATGLDAITPRMVEASFKAVAARGVPTGNRWLATVRAAFHAAVDKGIIASNPCDPVRPYSETDRARVRTLNSRELGAIVKAVEALANPWHKALLMGLLETGCRVSELLAAKWEDIVEDEDEGKAVLLLRSPKAGRLQTVPLQPATLARFQALPAVNEYVFPAARGRGHMDRTTARGVWREVCSAAGVEGVTLHDVRRTVGLYIAREAGIAMAAKVLRHSKLDVTAKVYAPFNVAETRKAAEAALVKQGKLVHLRAKGKARAAKQAG